MRQRHISGIQCTCGHTFSAWATFEGGDLLPVPCPKCAAPCTAEKHEPERTYGNRRFSGEGAVSVTDGFHPAEVNIARKLMPKSADCIRSDGSVVYNDSQSVKTFQRELQQAKRRLGVPESRPW